MAAGAPTPSLAARILLLDVRNRRELLSDRDALRRTLEEGMRFDERKETIASTALYEKTTGLCDALATTVARTLGETMSDANRATLAELSAEVEKFRKIAKERLLALDRRAKAPARRGSYSGAPDNTLVSIPPSMEPSASPPAHTASAAPVPEPAHAPAPTAPATAPAPVAASVPVSAPVATAAQAPPAAAVAAASAPRGKARAAQAGVAPQPPVTSTAQPSTSTAPPVTATSQPPVAPEMAAVGTAVGVSAGAPVLQTGARAQMKRVASVGSMPSAPAQGPPERPASATGTRRTTTATSKKPPPRAPSPQKVQRPSSAMGGDYSSRNRPMVRSASVAGNGRPRSNSAGAAVERAPPDGANAFRSSLSSEPSLEKLSIDCDDEHTTTSGAHTPPVASYSGTQTPTQSGDSCASNSPRDYVDAGPLLPDTVPRATRASSARVVAGKSRAADSARVSAAVAASARAQAAQAAAQAQHAAAQQAHAQHSQHTSTTHKDPAFVQNPLTAQRVGAAHSQTLSLVRQLSGDSPSAALTARKNKRILRGYDPKIIDIIEGQIVDHAARIGFDEITGLEGAKQALTEMVILPSKRPELFTGLRTPEKGLLLFGPPGNGKTMLAKAVASEADAVFFNISASSLTSKYVGESEKLVSALFALARDKHRAIIFIDEIDSILRVRNTTEHEATRRLKTEFLIAFDGVGSSSSDRIVVMAATNRPWELDEAALRRFPKRIFVPSPTAETRLEMLRKLLVRQRHELSHADFVSIAEMTEGYSFSDLASLAKDAAFGPLRELGSRVVDVSADRIRPIRLSDFMRSVQRIRPSNDQAANTALDQWRAGKASSVD